MTTKTPTQQAQFTKEQLAHIKAMCESDINDGNRVIRDVPKATLLHEEWRKCIRLDEEILKELEE